MELYKAKEKCITVRICKDKPVGKAFIEEILTMAMKPPSWGNIHAWELAVVGGIKHVEIKKTSITYKWKF